MWQLSPSWYLLVSPVNMFRLCMYCYRIVFRVLVATVIVESSSDSLKSIWIMFIVVRLLLALVSLDVIVCSVTGSVVLLQSSLVLLPFCKACFATVRQWVKTSTYLSAKRTSMSMHFYARVLNISCLDLVYSINLLFLNNAVRIESTL